MTDPLTQALLNAPADGSVWRLGTVTQVSPLLVQLGASTTGQPCRSSIDVPLAVGNFVVVLVNGADRVVVGSLTARSNPSLCNGRLTLTSGTPVTTADVTGAGTIYFTPFRGNRLAVFDGTNWQHRTFTELSLALALTSGNVYDVFVYDNAGTLTLETLIWTNATTRATALVLQDGVLCKSGALTRRYLGTIYASGTNTTEDSILRRYVWNYYNRVRKRMYATEPATAWAYSVAAWRSYNNNNATRIQMVVGVVEDAVDVKACALVSCTQVAYPMASVGYDSTVTPTFGNWIYMQIPVADRIIAGSNTDSHYPGIGFHYYQLLELGDAARPTQTFYGQGVGNVAYVAATVFA